MIVKRRRRRIRAFVLLLLFGSSPLVLHRWLLAEWAALDAYGDEAFQAENTVALHTDKQRVESTNDNGGLSSSFSLAAHNRVLANDGEESDHFHQTKQSASPYAVTPNDNLKQNVVVLQQQQQQLRTDTNDSFHCFYREYERTTDLHSGLPFVAEVFAAHDRQSVWIAAEGRKGCQERYELAHAFEGTQFDCVFEQDGSRTVSEAVPPNFIDDVANHAFVAIQCPVPEHLQHTLPLSGAPRTSAFLTLQARIDLVTLTKPFLNQSNRPTN